MDRGRALWRCAWLAHGFVPPRPPDPTLPERHFAWRIGRGCVELIVFREPRQAPLYSPGMPLCLLRWATRCLVLGCRLARPGALRRRGQAACMWASLDTLSTTPW